MEFSLFAQFPCHSFNWKFLQLEGDGSGRANNDSSETEGNILISLCSINQCHIKNELGKIKLIMFVMIFGGSFLLKSARLFSSLSKGFFPNQSPDVLKC